MLSPVTRQVVFINAAHLFTHYSLLILATATLAMVQQRPDVFGTDYGPLISIGTGMFVAYGLLAANATAGRECRAMLLMMIIADETDEAAMAKWDHYVEGTDHEALAWRDGQAAADVKAEAHSTVGRMVRSDRVPTNMLRLIGSYGTIARQLDELALMPGLRGVMLTFDDYRIGMEQFGNRIQPLMRSRAGRV